jgi:hypothetical protein
MRDTEGEWLRVTHPTLQELELPQAPDKFLLDEHNTENENIVYTSGEIFSPDETEEDYFPLFPEADLGETTHHHRLRSVRKSIRGHRAAKYIVDFERGANAHAVTVASMDVESIDQERARLAEHLLEQKREETRRHEFEMNAIKKSEKSSFKRIQDYFKKQREKRVQEMKERENEHKRGLRELNMSYQKIKDELKITMDKRKNFVKKQYGTLRRHDDRHLFLKRKIQLRQSNEQHIKVNLRLIRGVKDRLPPGYYALLVSIRDRVGGRIIATRGSKMRRGSEVHAQSIIRSSKAFFHYGTSKDLDVTIEDVVELVVPSKRNRKPYLVISFELIQVDGQYPGVCVAWSSFPLENPHFGVVSGPFKTPMIRGWSSATVDQYWKMHKIYDTSIDMWSGNLYFEVHPLPIVDDDFFELKSVIVDEEVPESGSPDMNYLQETRSVDENEMKSFSGEPLIDNESEEIQIEETKLETKSETKLEQQVRIDQSVLNRHHYALKRPEGYKEFTLSLKKGKYLAKAVLNDMELRTFLSPYLYVTLALFVISFWIRIYFHYFGQWFYLTVIAKMPDVSFQVSFVTVFVNYQGGTLSFGQESMVVAAGVLLNMIIFGIFVFLVWMFQLVRVSIPSFASKFVTTFGVMTMLDPFLILIVDCAYQRWTTGDAMKLYWNATANEQSAAWGVLTTLLIYAWAVLLLGFLLYHFLLKIFMNGQIIDIFRRVHGTERTFFLPNDLEVSQDEMLFAVEKAMRYRGQGGELRRLLAMEYTLTDPKFTDFKQTTQHFIIYTLEVDGGEIKTDEKGSKVVMKGKRKVKEIYRQFLQLNNHTLIEIFSESDTQVLNNHVKLIDINGIQQFEDEEAKKAADDENWVKTLIDCE